MLLTDQLEEKVKIHSHNTMRYAVQLAKIRWCLFFYKKLPY